MSRRLDELFMKNESPEFPNNNKLQSCVKSRSRVSIVGAEAIPKCFVVAGVGLKILLRCLCMCIVSESERSSETSSVAMIGKSFQFNIASRRAQTYKEPTEVTRARETPIGQCILIIRGACRVLSGCTN